MDFKGLFKKGENILTQKYHHNRELHAKATLLIYNVLLAFGFFILYTNISLITEFRIGFYLQLFCILVVFLFGLLICRGTPLVVLANLVGLAITSNIGISVWYSGGIQSPVFMWVVIQGFLALQVLSIYWSVAWLLITILELIYFSVLDFYGIGLPKYYNTEMDEWLRYSTYLGCAFAFYMIGFLYQSMRTRVQKKLEEARQKINNQNLELQSYNQNLERIVQSRTEELIFTNTELIQFNNQLQQFTYIVSHNLRGPIARIIGLSQLLENKNNNAELQPMIQERIKEAALDLDEIIHDLNHILEIKSGLHNQFEHIDLHAKLDKVISSLGSMNSEVPVHILRQMEVTRIYSQRSYMESILYNLISNAFKYRSPFRPLEITIVTKLSDNQILIGISDNGLGIDLQKFGDKVFGLYKRFNNHTEGKGLGLYLVKTQTEALQGKIEILSEVNQGTTFWITLPNKSPD